MSYITFSGALRSLVLFLIACMLAMLVALTFFVTDSGLFRTIGLVGAILLFRQFAGCFRHLSILVADDERLGAEKSARILKRSFDLRRVALQIDLAFRYQDVARKLEQGRYDVVIADLHFPSREKGINAMSLAKGHGAKVVLLTAARIAQEALDHVGSPTGAPLRVDLIVHKPLDEDSKACRELTGYLEWVATSNRAIAAIARFFRPPGGQDAPVPHAPISLGTR